MKLAILIVIVNLSGISTKLLKPNRNDKVIELITDAGYEGEAHRVETEDGYLLKVHRLLPKTKDKQSERKPVFLMHGILATAADFLVTGPEIALAYLLADSGYDVWLGNARGSRYSMKHRNFSADSREFWKFSWHEIGFYDLPKMIDYTLHETKSTQLFYVGHSQGTTSLLVLLSMRPQYNAKIAEAHLLAPSAFRKKLPRLRTIIYGLEFLDSVDDFSYLDLTALLRVEDAVSKILCREDSIFLLKLCVKIISLIVGKNQKEIHIDTKILPDLMKHLSTRVSIMQLTHYYQNMINDNFRLFDHKQKNLIYYNSMTPPEYQLSLISAPLFLYHASEDRYASVKGAKHLASLLPNVQKFTSIADWNHIDFVYGKNSREILYQKIVKSFNSSL